MSGAGGDVAHIQAMMVGDVAIMLVMKEFLWSSLKLFSVRARCMSWQRFSFRLYHADTCAFIVLLVMLLCDVALWSKL